jgi:uncharacterized lipoprotein YmbA
MQSLVNDAVAEALSQKIVEQVMTNFAEKWNLVLEELASTRKSNEQLHHTVEQLQAIYSDQTTILGNKLEKATLEMQKTRENNLKASEILKVATKELGLSE